MTRLEDLDLAALIERRRSEESESYGEIARRAGISKPYVYKLATQPITSIPRPATIAALARGLCTTERVIRQAALVSTHMLDTTVELADPRLDAIATSLEDLSERDLQIIKRMIATMHESGDASSE